MFEKLLANVKYYISKVVVFLLGWKMQGTMPSGIQKFVLICIPHTSNWDFLYMMLSAWHYKVKIRWMGKKEMFKNIFSNFICSKIGGLEVDRSQANKTVEKIVNIIKDTPNKVCLVIAPEGSRSKKDGIRSGFYNISVLGKFPIALGFVDYAKKRMGIGPLMKASGDIHKDLVIIKEFYKEVTGRHPKNQSPIEIVSRN